MPSIQLDRILQSQGFGTRKNCRQLIEDGEVAVNGEVVRDYHQAFDTHGLKLELFDEVWAYRDLLAVLVRRDISVRYKQSAVGFGWILLQPLAMMLVFSIIFGRFAKLPSDGVPYPLFAMSALLPWLYFSKALVGSSDSLVSASHMIKKVYCPRLVIPLSRTLSGLVDFAITFLILGAMLLWYGVMPG